MRILSLIFIITILFQGHSEAEEKFIPVNNGKLFCRTMGSGKPLIIIHGGAGWLTQDYLLPHLEPLAKNRLLVFYDQRALGKSKADINAEDISINTYVEDIETIRKDLGCAKISILGHSWGGLLAIHYALAFPDRVENMLLISPQSASSSDLGMFFAELEKRTASYQKELHELESSHEYLTGTPECVAKVNQIYFQTYLVCPENVRKLNLTKTQPENLCAAKVWAIFRDSVFTHPYDLFQSLENIKCPTLILHGDKDVIPFVSSEHIHTAIPSSTLVKILECGHFPFVEQPEFFFNHVTIFLNKDP